MPETTIDSFLYGDWVRCDGQVMLVDDSSGCAYLGKLGLRKEDAPVIYDKEMAIQYPEAIYYPVEAVEKLPEVDVGEAVMRSFFQLETTPWRLCEQGLFPFSDQSGTFTLTEDDLKVFAGNLPKADSIVIDNWKEQFASRRHVTHVYCPYEETNGLSLNLVWIAIREIMTWFDIEEDEPEAITNIIDVYFASKGKELCEIDAPDSLMASVITAIEENAEDSEPTKDEKKAYVCFLDKMCSRGDSWALEKKAYAYYGGNKFVPCDWKISEQALLKLEHAGNKYAANSLGYIYYSDRLGEPDYDKAFHYFSEAAEAGVAEARYKLSDLYRKGHGVEKDPDKAIAMLKKVYSYQLAAIKDGDFCCNYADVALRMGYCYEEGAGCEKDLKKAREYFLRAKYAIEMRILRGPGFGDEVVRRNIEAALERVGQQEDSEEIRITDLPGYPEMEYSSLSAWSKKALLGHMEYLYGCDFCADDFDPDGRGEHLDRAMQVMKKYSDSDFYTASFEWMKKHCETADQYINFANLYYYYGGTNLRVADPYPFLAYLYNGIDWDGDKIHAEETEDLFYSIAVELIQGAGIYHGYADEYEPFEDERLKAERVKIKEGGER